MNKKEFIDELISLRPILMIQSMNYMKNKEESEDIVQEVLIKLFEMRLQFENARNIRGMAYTMTKNLSFNRIRDIKKEIRLCLPCLRQKKK